MALVNLPKTNQTGTNEWADVEDNDQAIVDEVNGSLENVNIAANAQIDHSKLADTTGGYILVANSSSVITGVAMSGDATISDTGAVTIGAGVVDTTELADDAVTSAKANLDFYELEGTSFAIDGTYDTITGVTQSVAAGTWLVVAEILLNGGGSGVTASVKIRTGGLSEVERTGIDLGAGEGEGYTLTAIATPAVTATIDVQVKTGGTIGTADGRMVLVRIA